MQFMPAALAASRPFWLSSITTHLRRFDAEYFRRKIVDFRIRLLALDDVAGKNLDLLRAISPELAAHDRVDGAVRRSRTDCDWNARDDGLINQASYSRPQNHVAAIESVP